ncbi:FRITZ protein, partial [Polypterus senegalus]
MPVPPIGEDAALGALPREGPPSGWTEEIPGRLGELPASGPEAGEQTGMEPAAEDFSRQVGAVGGGRSTVGTETDGRRVSVLAVLLALCSFILQAKPRRALRPTPTGTCPPGTGARWSAPHREVYSDPLGEQRSRAAQTTGGRLRGEGAEDRFVLADTFMILTFLEKNKVCYVQFTKKQSSPDLSRRLEKLSISELKVSYVDLPGPSGRRVDRRLALNCLQDMAICWWPTINDSAWPWSPISSERDRANLVLLGCTNDSFQILHCIHTEWDPLDAGFSISQPYQLYTVEHSINADKEKMADSCIYDCSRNKVHRITVTSIPLKSRAISCSLDCTEEKLILGCQDSSLVLYDSHRQVTLLAQADLLPTIIEWHPSGAMFVVGSSQGELQCFDVAIAPLKVQVLAEDLNPKVNIQFNKHFNVSTSLTQIQWAVGQGPSQSGTLNIHDLLFLRFDKGPLGMLCFKLGAMTTGQLGHTELVHQCIRYGQIDEAVNILSAINWNTMGPDCYICLSAIFDHLLRQNLTAEREAQIEAALGTFYTPARPLTETTVLEYRDAICKYARRFFHHLLRYQRFEKAFLLAIDIGARDLYMDIHYLALDKGELVLAEVAKKKANEIDAESITTGVGFRPLMTIPFRRELNNISCCELELTPRVLYRVGHYGCREKSNNMTNNITYILPEEGA